MTTIDSLFQTSVGLLKDLIAIPSFSKQEDDTATLLARFFVENDIEFQRKQNNFWAFAQPFDSNKPTVWLNSHHDTVKPNSGYTKDPFSPIVEYGKLFGLGSNDAGGCLVSLIAAFLHFKNQDLPFNLLMIASAEEEISGKQGIGSLIDILPEADLAIVGEPTQMRMAVAEKGLMVIDAIVKGKAGHAARDEGVNAIYQSLQDLAILKNFKFKKKSNFLGESKVSATVIHAGTQHNVVPDLCEITLDVRVTDAYTLEEAYRELSSHLSAELRPRSMRLQSSSLPHDHRILSVAKELKLETFGSPTLSDQALIPYPSVKIGPGDSARSHSADEFIHLEEIKGGISGYISILEAYSKYFTSSDNS
ncbi:M20/M25/M40 family metallo-hydrolase [Algoriphagus hitonicola]|uniref:Acetylornithine deacetylase n=1 Tax=Algoriphagus hitonicola TaxID=435880 RepID=A0A1I2RAT6_9BACT|nr:M20/M25/M40 family metallo-hydrolase [Algoriphagus hitonicola]SFG37794.1 acetylornithine deacetylase [Algoriphagus hitonicola]